MRRDMDYELLFPVWYKQDFRELMEYIDSQFALIEDENNNNWLGIVTGL